MQTLLIGVTLALAGQAADGGPYGVAPPEAAAAQLVIHPETPTPTLDEAPAEETTDSAETGNVRAPISEPATSEPLDQRLSSAGNLGAADDPAAIAQPAAAEAPPERSVIAGGGPKPSELMRVLAKPPVDGQLSGIPLSLGEAVREATSRQDQTARVKTYWDLAAATTEYYLALREAKELATLRQGVNTPGAVWDQKQRELDARVKVARQTAQAAQLRLHQLAGRTTGSLPLPADIPHCGRYDARYGEIFANRHDPAAEQLNELLPLRYEQLRAQAAAVTEGLQWLAGVSETRDPNTDGTGLLQAHDLLSLRRRAFVATAREYNHEIATYTELAAPTGVESDRLVAMMIHASNTGAEAPWRRPDIQQAGATEPAGQDDAAASGGGVQSNEGDDSGARRTFAGGYREVRRPLQRLLNREKSIVVKRLLSRVRGRE